jgi:hypothetical protein
MTGATAICAWVGQEANHKLSMMRATRIAEHRMTPLSCQKQQAVHVYGVPLRPSPCYSEKG